MKPSQLKCAAPFLAVWCLMQLTGCTPPPGSGSNTPIERYIDSGKVRESQHDYRGALADFGKALALDPDSADAHYEIANVYENNLNAPIKALYHYTRVLEIDSEYQWKDIISNRVSNLRMRVAEGRIPMVPCPELERQVSELSETIAEKNRELQRLVDANRRLQQQLRGQGGAPSQPPITSRNPTSSPPPDERVTRPPDRPVSQGNQGGSRVSYDPPGMISYTILEGDTLYSLKRRYNVELADILKANPGIDQNNLQVGQQINIPQP